MSRFRPKQRQRDANIFGSGKKLIKTGDEKDQEGSGRAGRGRYLQWNNPSAWKSMKLRKKKNNDDGGILYRDSLWRFGDAEISCWDPKWRWRVLSFGTFVLRRTANVYY